MKIQWYGQSFFLFTSDLGCRVAIDPFHDNVGYELPDVTADIVTISHNHKDHNNCGLIKGNPKIISTVTNYSDENITINGVLTSHGKFLGNNIIFTYLFDGLNICHLGDLGVLLTNSQVEELGKIDVLLLPIGGGMQVLNSSKAEKVMAQLSPKLTIPMHFKTPAMRGQFFMFDTEKKFIDKTNGRKAGGNIINVSETLKNYNGVLVLDYKQELI